MAANDSTNQPTKLCRKCGQAKPLTMFLTYAARPTRSKGRRPNRKPPGLRTSGWCKQCEAAKGKAWKKRNPDRSSEHCRRVLIRKHGIEPEQYGELLEKQKGACAICERTHNGTEKGMRPRSLAIDHDHDTGRIRGLLCTRCNNMLGNADDDVALLKSAIVYLKSYKGRKSG